VAIAFVQCTELRSGTGTASGTVTATAGNALIACVCEYQPSTNGVLTVSGGGTWTTNLNGTRFSFVEAALASCPSATGGSNTISVTATNAGAITAFILEFSGMATSSMFEAAGATSNGTATTKTTSALTNTAANAVKIAVVALDGGGNTAWASLGTGWTMPTNGSEPDGTSWFNGASGYKIVSASQSDTESWSRTGTETWAAEIATYLASSGAPPQDTPELYGRPDGLGGQRTMTQLLAQ
jgi:hypothetical protein